jgi:hypothetical protein
MNEDVAKEILGFERSAAVSPQDCKRQFRQLALRYHPDKNPSEEAKHRFQEINEAYTVLSNAGQPATPTDYKTMLRSFLKECLHDTENTGFLHQVYTIVDRIASLCCTLSKDDLRPILHSLFDQTEKHTVEEIAGLIGKYSLCLHITQHITGILEEVIEDKARREVYLYPCIDDVFEGKASSLTIKGANCIVPLWHHLLNFDNEFYVYCLPNLAGEPNKTWIDNHNNLCVSLQLSLADVLERPMVEFSIGSRQFSFERRALKLEKKQVYRLVGVGIPKINKADILDISAKSDVLVTVTLIMIV